MLDEEYGVTIDDYDQEFLLLANHRANMNKAQTEGFQPAQEKNAVYIQINDSIDTFSSNSKDYLSFREYMNSVEGKQDAILGLRAGSARNSQKHYREEIPVNLVLPATSFGKVFSKLESVLGVEKASFSYYGTGTSPIEAYENADLQMSCVLGDRQDSVYIVTAATENGMETRGISTDSGELLKKTYDVIDELEIAYDAFVAEAPDRKKGQWIVADEGAVDLEDRI